MRARNAAWACLLLSSCAAANGSSDATLRHPQKAECAYRLSPEPSPRLPAAATERSREVNGAPRSQLVVHLNVGLARLAEELERRVARRLAAEEAVSLGPAGRLEYSVERGPLSLSVAGGKLVVAAAIVGRAQACAGGRCYASCEPRGVARVELPLLLRADYRSYPSRVSFDFTHGCKVRLLGGFLTVDVTSSLRAELTRRLTRIAREIDREVPDARPRVESAYQELSRSRALPVGCLALNPEAVVQGPIQDSTHSIRARFALRARPELRSECDASARTAPLPELIRDLELPEHDSVLFGMEVPLSSVDRAFEESGVVSPHARVAEAEVEAAGAAVRADLMLAGEICGPLTLYARPVFAEDGAVVRFESGSLNPEAIASVRAANLDAARLVGELTNGVRVGTPFSLGALRATLPFLASALSTKTLAVTSQVNSLRAAGVEIREGSLLAQLEARGSLHVEQR